MSAKVITKKSRNTKGGAVSGDLDLVDKQQAILDNFPTGKPRFNTTIPGVLTDSHVSNKNIDRNSMLYMCNKMRSNEKSLDKLANWEQVLNESK